METIVNTLLQLIRINSETGNEFLISNVIESLLIKNDFTVMKQKVDTNRYNVIAYPQLCDPKEIKLLFSGHIDTVPIEPSNSIAHSESSNSSNSIWTTNPYGELKNNNIYGRGSVDMKGGIACFICAGLEMMKNKNKFAFIFTVGEEINMIGLAEHLWQPHTFLVQQLWFGDLMKI